MLKVNFRNVLLFIFVKYFIFYIFLMLKNEDYTLIGIKRLRNFNDWFYYLWLFISFPGIISIIFSAPIYYAFKIKNVLLFVLVILAIFTFEYFIYTYLESPSDFINGFYNAGISLILFILFFYKQIHFKIMSSRK